MNVYDFDNTIYNGDSTLDFWMHCIQKYPKALLAFPGALLYGILFRMKLCSRERFKEKFYAFLRYIPDSLKEIQLFWDLHLTGIKQFYWEMRQPDDLVISASPDFLISEVCQRLGISYIASEVDANTGKLKGANCRGEEKLLRFREQYPEGQIKRFYSDSTSDVFLAREAQEAFLVKKNVIQKWRI